jgi:hypothetical protein
LFQTCCGFDDDAVGLAVVETACSAGSVVEEEESARKKKLVRVEVRE